MSEHYLQPNSQSGQRGAPDWRARVLRIVFPIVTVALVLGLKLIAPESLRRDVPFLLLLLLLPVILAAWYGGAASGLVATVLAAAGAGYFFLRPYGAFGLPDRRAELHLGLFVLEGTLVALFVASARAREKERAALEQAGREAKVREELLSVVGHDLRNPLGAIKVTGAVLLQNPSLDDLTRKKIGRIVSVSDRMARLISQLLDFSRARVGGGLPLEPVETDLNRISEQVIEEMRAATPGRSIHYDSRGELIGRWDPDRVAELLSNLIGNAIQYGDPAKAVTVRLSSHDDDALIEVHNWGAPIPEEALSYIFEPFRRASMEKSASVGLGLYIAQQIVVGHGGTIRVSSSLSEGTVFSARLPRSLAMDTAGERNPSPAA